MISEKIICSQFQSFWDETLPLLTPSFVRVFNEASSEDLTDYAQSQFKYIPVGEHIEKHDLVAELSFQIAKYQNKTNFPLTKIRDKEGFNIVYQNSINFLKRYRSENPEEILVSEFEINESFKIANEYQKFFEFLGATQIEFSPKIQGSGFLGRCEADLSIANTIYEIKTVSRNISSKDIKQLIIYLALQHSSGINRWSHAGFFNPRKSIHYRFSVDHLIYRTSGGRATSEVFKDLIDFLSSRDLQIDSIF